MLNVEGATTLEIQIFRDQCQNMLDLLASSFHEGIITKREWLAERAPYKEAYQQCINRLIADWHNAMQIARTLE